MKEHNYKESINKMLNKLLPEYSYSEEVKKHSKKLISATKKDLRESNKVFNQLFTYLIPKQFRKASTKKSSLSLEFLKYLIPTKRRDEIIGDFYELRDKMKSEGFSNFQIKIALMVNIVFLSFSLLKIRFRDYFEVTKQVKKD